MSGRQRVAFACVALGILAPACASSPSARQTTLAVSDDTVIVIEHAEVGQHANVLACDRELRHCRRLLVDDPGPTSGARSRVEAEPSPLEVEQALGAREVGGWRTPSPTSIASAGVEAQVFECDSGCGHLYLMSFPWCELQVDGVLVGHTPVLGLSVPAGLRQLRCTNPESGRVTRFEVSITAATSQRMTIGL